MTDTGQPERRRAPRIPEKVRVMFRALEDEGTRPVAAETVNMSASGLCLRSPVALNTETHLALELALEGETGSVMSIGRVVWCDRDGDEYRVGVCFTWMREEDRAALQVIADYVSARTET